MRTLIHHPRNNPVRSRRHYHVSMLILWGLALAWLATMYFIFSVWQPASWIQWIVSVLLIGLAPTPSDLFLSYDKYLRQFESESEVEVEVEVDNKTKSEMPE